ncbi:hypothetical protein ABRA89_05675 [Fulvimarina sp. MAC8]
MFDKATYVVKSVGIRRIPHRVAFEFRIWMNYRDAIEVHDEDVVAVAVANRTYGIYGTLFSFGLGYVSAVSFGRDFCNHRFRCIDLRLKKLSAIVPHPTVSGSEIQRERGNRHKYGYGDQN